MLHVNKAHSAFTKHNPSSLTFAMPKSLKHGNILLLNQEIENG